MYEIIKRIEIWYKPEECEEYEKNNYGKLKDIYQVEIDADEDYKMIKEIFREEINKDMAAES